VGHLLQGRSESKSFLFTLKNPRNFPVRNFALKSEKKDQAIDCWSSCDPNFRDICVADHCNRNSGRRTSLGSFYANDTGRDWKTFFTGLEYFVVKEIEVFEIAD
jgi:hypothetical protein